MSVLVFFDLLDPNIFNSFYSIFHKSCLVDLALLKCETRNLYRNVVCEKAFKEEVGPPKKEATFFELSSLFPEGLYLAFKKAFCVLERESEGGRQLQHKIARFSL